MTGRHQEMAEDICFLIYTYIYVCMMACFFLIVSRCLASMEPKDGHSRQTKQTEVDFQCFGCF